MKRIVIASLIVLLVLPSCKFIKTKILSKKIDTLSAYVDTAAARVNAAVPQENQTFAQPESQPAENVQQSVTNPVTNAQFYMIVGSFTVPENANKYAEKIKGMGYEGEIIAGHDGFQMVTAKSYNNFSTSVADIEQFRSNVTPNAWVYVKK
jgi:hypothetical protein